MSLGTLSTRAPAASTPWSSFSFPRVGSRLVPISSPIQNGHLLKSASSPRSSRLIPFGITVRPPHRRPPLPARRALYRRPRARAGIAPSRFASRPPVSWSFALDKKTSLRTLHPRIAKSIHTGRALVAGDILASYYEAQERSTRHPSRSTRGREGNPVREATAAVPTAGVHFVWGSTAMECP